MTISKSELDSDIFSVFNNLFNDNIDNPHSGDKWIFSSFPDGGFNTSSHFPIIIIHPIEISDEEEFTMTKNKVKVRVSIEVDATKWVTVDKYIQQVFNLVDTKRHELRNNHTIKRIKLVDTDEDTFERGKIKLHMKEKTFEFEYTYTKNPGY